MGWAGLCVAVGALLNWLAAGPAKASAWNEEAGHGIVIADVTLMSGNRYFNGAGKLSRAAAYSKQEAIGYLEFGVTDWLTAIVKPAVVRISAAAGVDASGPTRHYGGLGTSEAGLQLHVASIGPAVFAVQGSVRVPGSSRHTNPALIGNTSHGGEIRGLSGLGFALGAWPAFVDVEVGYRFRSDGASAEWHGDVTAGARVLPRVLVLVQSFGTLCDGRGTAWYPAASYAKLGIAAVYDLSERWSIKMGVFQTILGVGALRERGVQAALWYRF